MPRDAVDRHLLLRHCLEQRRLRLRHRAVDLVDEHDVREDRPGTELELPGALVVDRQPCDVGRLQVGRALDPRERRTLDGLRNRARENRLRRARHVLEEHMPAGCQRREHERDLLVLAEDDLLDVAEQPIGGGRRPVAGHGTNRNACGRPLSR